MTIFDEPIFSRRNKSVKLKVEKTETENINICSYFSQFQESLKKTLNLKVSLLEKDRAGGAKINRDKINNPPFELQKHLAFAIINKHLSERKVYEPEQILHGT